jgi:LuxR family transcriptional regulator, maltose regulon positive regulatory protein
MLADHVPGGSRLALSGRAEPPLRIARLRAEGRILEIGPGDLSLTPSEAASLLRNAGVAVGDDEAADLQRRTEGWPAGLYLAALYINEGGSAEQAAVSFGGDDRFVSDYMESEFLSRISRQQRSFLTRTAMLERMCGPLCDAVLGQSGSAAALANLGRSNLLLVPLDRRRQWYRYHHLFRDMLLAELEHTEPGLAPVLRRRAAAWCLSNELPEEALEYSIAAADAETAADLVESSGYPPTTRVVSRPCSDGSDGWKTRARSPLTRWSRRRRQSSPCGRDSRSRLSAGPTCSIAGSTEIRPGPAARTRRPGPR